MNQALCAARSALVLVDYQQRLLPQIAGSAEVLNQALRLADIADALDVPVLGTEQNPAGLGANDAAIRARCARTLSKMHFDACEDGLLEVLCSAREPSPVDIVLAGCEAHVCLLQTGLGLLRAGLRVWVVADACGSRRAAHHELAMQRLRQAGAVVVCTEMVAFEWLHGCEQAQFKTVLRRVKDS